MASSYLEETGLPYEPHLVNFETNDQLSLAPIHDAVAYVGGLIDELELAFAD
jgi:hypothetical protein